MSPFSLKKPWRQNKISCQNASVQWSKKKQKIQTVHVTMWRCLYDTQRYFFSTLCFSHSPSSALSAFCFHMQTVLGSTSHLFFFNCIYFLFKYSVLFPTFFFSLFTLCTFVHSCVTWLLNLFLSFHSSACKEKASFLKNYLLRTSSSILELKYKSNYFLTVFTAGYQGSSSALILSMILVDLLSRWNTELSVNNWDASGSLSQIIMVCIAQTMSIHPVLRCNASGHIAGMVEGGKWRPAAFRLLSVALNPLKMLNHQLYTEPSVFINTWHCFQFANRTHSVAL